MVEDAELEATLARLEAALSVAQGAVTATEGAPDVSGELAEARASLAAAEARADSLEAELRAAMDALANTQEALSVADTALAEAPSGGGQDSERMRGALDALTSQLDGLLNGAGDADAALRAQIEALRAARALDLAEMQALLTELEPLLEPAHA